MWGDVLLLLLALALLTGGADFLVKGSGSLARRLSLTPLVIGLTVVAFGTSSPELAVSLDAAVTGHGDMVLGNVVGSNIFNVGIILGLTAVICPVAVSLPLIRFDGPVMIAASLLCVGLVGYGTIQRTVGMLLVSSLIIYIGLNIRKAKRQSGEVAAAAEAEMPSITKSIYRDILLTGGGLGLLALGSHLLVASAIGISRLLNVSEAVIGLTVVAAGTSMPELATSLLAAIRRHPDIAVGNVVGSNIFNILGILGISSAVRPLSAPGVGMREAWAMLAFAVAAMPLLWTGRRLMRWEGAVLLLGYGAYLWMVWPAG
jgi:cation:H+ antiporter